MSEAAIKPFPAKPAEGYSTIYKKVRDVMQKVGWVEKRGENKFHKYKYATEADVTDKVRAACCEVGLVMIPTVKSISQREKQTREGHATITQVLMGYRVVDVDTGEGFEFEMAGEGMDSGDKSVFKAVTGAGKYADMKLFQIPTGDDPEADEKTDRATAEETKVVPITDAQYETIRVAVEETQTPWPDFLRFFDVKTLEELPAADFDRAVRILDQKKKNLAKAKVKA